MIVVEPTFFNAVLACLAIAFDLACYALNALVVVVLSWPAFLGV